MMSNEEAKKWAEHFIRTHNEFYEYGALFEDDEFMEGDPSAEDAAKVLDLMIDAKLEVRWDG